MSAVKSGSKRVFEGRGAGRNAAASSFLSAWLLALAIVAIAPAAVFAEDPLEAYRQARENYITAFRVSGEHDPAPLAKLERELRSLVDKTQGETQARALFELGSVERLSNEHQQAVATLTDAAKLAAEVGRSDIAFDAWISVARSHVIGDQNHGAAAEALDRAIAAAAANPTPKQRFDIARLYTESLVARGEIDAGLVSALDTVDVAPASEDRFYGELDTGDAIEKIANSCDYRPIWDDRSNDDPPTDPWGACRRAVVASRAAYERAARTADSLGWKALSNYARQFIKSLEVRQWLIDERSRVSPALAATFAPREKKDVLVLKGEFARRVLAANRGGAAAGRPELARAVEMALADADKASGARESPSSLYLRGMLVEMKGGETGEAAELYARAAAMLEARRAGFFDPRRRGTVIESSGEIFRELAMSLLALNRDAEAFGALEGARARGLSEMEGALAQKDVTQADRAELAELLRLEAEASASESRIVERVVGEGMEAPAADLSTWRKVEADRRSYLLGHENLRERFAQEAFAPVTLANLQLAANRAGTPALLYWVANPNIVAWYVGPHGSDVRVVFLPEALLTQKIAQLVSSTDKPGAVFNQQAAKELYLYLVAPFEDLLDSKQVIIVPQGPVVGLPFEALIDPSTGDYLVNRWVVTYAPNATMAQAALDRTAPSIKRVTAVVDPELSFTKEKEGIESVDGLVLRAFDSNDVAPDRLGEALAGAQSAHILMHGAFDVDEPLRSTLTDTSHRSSPMPATSLLALPLQGMSLVVLSACESGRLEVRLSNEIYGFPWVLLASGVQNVVTSRWVVDGASNGAWMHSFYSALAGGSSPGAAAAAAMRAMLRQGKSDPYYWAAMQVNGR